ncbi:MAG: hypothetical protein ABJA74_03130 [Lapillicoccus sp.]
MAYSTSVLSGSRYAGSAATASHPRSVAAATNPDPPAEQSSTRRGSRSGSSAKNAAYSSNDREVTSTYGYETT